MAELERWVYGNHELVAMRREGRICNGCATIKETTLWGAVVRMCANGVPKAKCLKYKPKQ